MRKAGQTSYWCNKDGYDACEYHVDYWFDHMFPTVIFKVTLDPVAPLTLYDDSIKRYCRFAKEILSDKGSVPWLATFVISRDIFERGFFIHDYEYQTGGLFMAHTLDGEYVFTETSKKQADDRLARTVEVDGGTPWQAGMVWKAVHLFGGWKWKKRYPTRKAQ